MSEQVQSIEGVSEWRKLVEEGNEAYESKKYNDAELKFVAALRVAEKWALPENFDALSDAEKNEINDHLAKSLNNMAALYHSQGKYAMAEDLYKRCLEIKKQLYGDDHLEVAVNLHNLAALYSAKRKWQLAEPLYQQALQIREKLLGEEHPDLVVLLRNYALMLRRSNRDDDAKALEERARQISEQVKA